MTIYLREKHIMASAIQVPLLSFHTSLITRYQLAYAQDTDNYWSLLLVVFRLVMSCFHFVKVFHCFTIKSSIVIISVCVIVYVESFMFVYIDSPSIRCGWKYG